MRAKAKVAKPAQFTFTPFGLQPCQLKLLNPVSEKYGKDSSSLLNQHRSTRVVKSCIR